MTIKPAPSPAPVTVKIPKMLLLNVIDLLHSGDFSKSRSNAYVQEIKQQLNALLETAQIVKPPLSTATTTTPPRAGAGAESIGAAQATAQAGQSIPVSRPKK